MDKFTPPPPYAKRRKNVLLNRHKLERRFVLPTAQRKARQTAGLEDFYLDRRIRT
jgi:hypothetical protein